MQTVHLLEGNDPALKAAVLKSLDGLYDVHCCDRWKDIPGSNNDPKLLLKPTTPVIVPVDDVAQVLEGLNALKVSGLAIDKRHPVLLLLNQGVTNELEPLIHAHDDFLDVQFPPESLAIKLNRIIARTDSHKKLSRDLNEASEIALLSMAHSSELGEISRFILRSYKCKTYDELFFALFETTESFLLECSALVIVDDEVTVQSSSGVVSQELKDTLLKYHDTKRVIDLGKEMIISYEHGSIMIHNMPQDDPARHGRLTDNLAVLGNCFEARVRGIEAEQKAEAASRAKTMFLATMSHELRTPMNSVIGYTGRLMKKLDGRLSDKEAKQLDAIRRNGDHLLKLINDILDMSKIEVGQMEIFLEPVDVAVLLRNVFDQLLPIAMNHNLAFEFESECDTVKTEVDPKRFTQIVMNLVSNAIKYTKDGSVTLSLSLTQDIEVGDAIAIGIKDTGIGISEEDQERLFGNFVQIDSATSRTVEGTGLGLAISAFFAKRHGGRIDVKSTVGEGSCFTLLIPIVP
ncbi:MAG: hypothetical protein K6L81_06425 [Agarilytica sp.]